MDIIENTTIETGPTYYRSGLRDTTFRNVIFKGRVNIDDTKGKSDNLIFDGCQFLSAPMSGTECLKLARCTNVTIKNCYFERTQDGGASDRLLDIVGGYRIKIYNNNFYNGNNGAIQAKGGVTDLEFYNNFVNLCGQRAIQIGGSTCWMPDKNTGCWGFENGQPTPPSRYGWEAINCKVYNNIVISNGSCFSLSTQNGTIVENNTFIMPYETGGVYLFRLLQEVEPQTLDQLKPSCNVIIKNNLFLYPVTRQDGKGGINANVVNWNSGVDLKSFTFENNAVYATTPITNSTFGKQGIYPHRHPVANGPNTWCPFNWQTGLKDQIYPHIVDWCTLDMVALAPELKDIGAKSFDIYNQIGARSMPRGPVATPSPKLETYGDTPLYGWEGNGVSFLSPEPVEIDYKEKYETLLSKLRDLLPE